jgi:hypothetical protein
MAFVFVVPLVFVMGGVIGAFRAFVVAGAVLVFVVGGVILVFVVGGVILVFVVGGVIRVFVVGGVIRVFVVGGVIRVFVVGGVVRRQPGMAFGVSVLRMLVGGVVVHVHPSSQPERYPLRLRPIAQRHGAR